MRLLRNPAAATLGPALGAPGSVDPSPRTFHSRLDGYSPSPLVELAEVAHRIGVRRVVVKHEADRFGLPAFKILGASWAVSRLVARHLGTEPQSGSPAGLRTWAAPLGPLTLVTATDGNHGRAVARSAGWFGFDAYVLVPVGTVAARISAIEGEGAVVEVVDGTYDDAVTAAAALADDSHIVVSDTSWPGYSQIPADIAEGYATIFAELDDQLGGSPDAVIVPVGVGALAVAAINHWPEGPPHGPTRIAVEPVDADCLSRSLEAGTPVTVPGPHQSIMAGMNCGTLSMLAWPIMQRGIDWAVTLDDDHARSAMRVLAEAGVVAGETGAASLGALLALAESKGPLAGGLDRVGLGPDSTVVCICTEGATDPVNYRKIVGHEPTSGSLG